MTFGNQTPGIFLLMSGGAIGIFFVRTLFRRRLINKWSVTEVSILEGKLNRIADSFELYVKYSYKVGGKGYTNDRISPVNYLTEDETQPKRPFCLIGLMQ